MTAGAYRIRNRVTGETYVGSTVNLYQRIGTHFRRLRAGTHPNKGLQLAWETFGKSAFSVGLLEETVATNEALLNAEERWMATLRPIVPGFYNRWSPKQGRCRPLRNYGALGVPLSQIVILEG